MYEEGVFKSKKGELKLLSAQSYKVEALRWEDFPTVIVCCSQAHIYVSPPASLF